MALLPQDGQSGAGDDGLEAYAPAARGGRAKKGSAPSRPSEAAAQPAAAPKGGGEAFSGLRVSLMPSEIEGKAPPDIGRGLLVLALVLIVETVLIGAGYFFVSRAIDSRVAKRAALEARLKELDAAVAKKEAAAKDAASYNGQVGAAKEALDKHVYWSKFFSLLEAKTRPTIKYLNFSGDADSGVVTLDATGRTYRDVAEQIVALREDPIIADVRTTSAAAKIAETGEVTGVSFTMVIRFKKEAWQGGSVTAANGGSSVPASGGTDADGAKTGESGKSTKDCGLAFEGDREAMIAQIPCVEERFLACLPATWGGGTKDTDVRTEILGPDERGRCLVKQKVLKDYDPEAVGLEMTCALIPQKYFSIAMSQAASGDFKECTGELAAYYNKPAR